MEAGDPRLGRVRRFLRWVTVASIVASGVLLILAIAIRPVAPWRSQILLSLFGVAAGALVADIGLSTLRRFPTPSILSLAAVALSQVLYYLLVWTDWKMDEILWRLWWLSMVPSVAGPHVLFLKNAASRKDWIERGTPWCASLSGLLLMVLGLYKEVPPTPGALFLWLIIPPALGSVIGTLVIGRRRSRQKGHEARMGKWARTALTLASQAGLFFIGFYVGGGTQPQASPFDLFPSALAGMADDKVDEQARADLSRLMKLAAIMEGIQKSSADLTAKLRELRQKERREFYRQEEDDQIRWGFVAYLSARAGLLRLAATYSGYQAVRHPEIRARCFMIGLAAGVTTYAASLDFVQRYRNDDVVRRKLNEADPAWGLSAGLFDQILQSVINERNIEMCREMAAYYEHKCSEWQGPQVWSKDDFQWLDDRIAAGLGIIRSQPVSPHAGQFDLLLKRVKKDAYTPVYAAQSMLSEWIGDTRIVEKKPLISIGRIKEIENRLRPGDILLERRNWYLSNAFLPGFWPHGALYVGRLADLERLKIADHPEIRARLLEYARPAHDGEPNTVVESVSEGVIFNSLTHSMHADYVAVLRPRVSEADAAQAIVKAFTHQGKPYDFEFDFFSTDKLVCTELVYRAYDGLIRFDLVRVAGRDTLPAIEIVRKFARERNEDRPQLDFVLFLDGEKEGSVEDFCSSADRPRAFNE